MYLSQTNIKALRHKIEQEGGFNIVLAPMQPGVFLNVKMATDNLYQELTRAGFDVLVDDRGQRPQNMFEVIDFLGIRHRVVISSRSISAGVYEYKDLLTDEFQKISEQDSLDFLKKRLRKT